MGSGIGAFYNDGRKLQKHEVARRKLDKRDRKLLKQMAKVEARKAAKERQDNPTSETMGV